MIRGRVIAVNLGLGCTPWTMDRRRAWTGQRGPAERAGGAGRARLQGRGGRGLSERGAEWSWGLGDDREAFLATVQKQLVRSLEVRSGKEG